MLRTNPNRKLILFLIFAVIFANSCSSTSNKGSSNTLGRQKIVNSQEGETVKDALSAIEGIAEAVSGKKLSDEELRALTEGLKNDKDARSAVQKITEGISSGNRQLKYSPATGKRYSADLEYDPETGVKLLPVE
ncbi:MAG: hypothetical protein HQL27_04165 [Candidatus Omnitrophica bacterium]|nr:hypothetical protein [Candidatus Omnitrophota bacterium]